MWQHLFYFSLYQLLWTVSIADANECFGKNIGGSNTCKCEHAAIPEHLYIQDLPLETENRVICIGENALEDAISVQKQLMISDLQILNDSLKSIHNSYLQSFFNLKNLTLSNNQITFLSAEAFKSQNNLILLDLSSNNLSALTNPLFDHLTFLQNLTLSHNEIYSIESNIFYNLYNLNYLDLSYNNIPGIDCNLFSNLKNLHHLLLHSNKISYLNGSFNLLHLQHLDLSSNLLKTLPNSVFFRLKNLKFLSLALNELETLNENILKGNINLQKIYLAGNYWRCDRKLLPLNDLLKKCEAYKEKAVCSSPPELQNYTLQHGLDYMHLEVQIEENPTCNQSMCNCSISKDKLVITVDCSSRGFTRLPEMVPYKTRLLNLHNNYIKSLTIDHIDANLWSDVSFLYLNNNIIDSLKGLEGTWLLRNLVALHLSNNQLTEIPIHILEQFKGGNLDELYLTGNPWNCDCNTVRFQTWLQDSYRTVRNFENICCSKDSGLYANHPIYRLKKSQLCPQQVELVNYLDILNSLMAITIILIILKLSYDYWLQKRTGKLPRFCSLNLN